jgi:pilus assembly protein CpaF
MSSGPLTQPSSAADRWFALRSQVHLKLLNTLSPEQLKTLNKEGVRAQIGMLVERLVVDEGIPMTLPERDRVTEEILDEVFGLGPLEQLLKDETISDIMVNGFDSVYIERFGRVVETNVRFKDQAHLRMIIERIVSNVGRRIDDSSPIVDARLGDGSRVCAVIPPLSLIGPVVSIRRYGKKLLSTADLLKNQTFTHGIVEFLSGCVEARLNIVISGGSGSGKTTMLNALSRFIPENERIITIEDTAELQLQQPHYVRLETRPANIEGAGAVTARDLLINTLRMRPDRIIVGESRGSEAIDMLQAMNTGHDGSMTTIHANTPRDALSRLETLVMMGSQHVPDRVIRQQIASAIDLVIQCTRLSDGTRKITGIAQITGFARNEIQMQDIFEFERSGISPRGHVVGRFRGMGTLPPCLERLRGYGIHLAKSIFDEVVEVRD